MSERRPPPYKSAYYAWRKIATRWMDNDIYGHVNNAVHYSLFDTAINGWLIDRRALDIANGPLIGLVVETGCRYFSEIVFPDVVTAGMRVARIGTSSVQYEIGLFRNDDEIAAAEGHFVHVYVDRVARRPTPIPDHMRQMLKDLSASSNEAGLEN